MIKFEKVFKRYRGGLEALSNVSFTVDKGEMVFITGPSGAGKSTLLRLILGLEQVTSGDIQVGSFNLKSLARQDIPRLRQQIGTVFQDHQLLKNRTAAENVALPLLIANYPESEASRRVRAALSKVGLQGKEKYLPEMLSGGEQQRVGIARAMVCRPKIILADEPTGNLDPELSLEIMSVFKQFQGAGVAVLIVTHDTSLISGSDSRVIKLDQGKLISITTGTAG
ncbi:MAG: cell division transport system ATP-binding protein [Pseudohongiellaceae bacterium]|jgi:cell division transport system ATP-binding protein